MDVAGSPLRLRDGRVVRLRPVRAADADGLVHLHERLSPRSRYFRYFSPKPRLSRLEAEHFADVDGHQRLGAVATATEDGDAAVVALGSLFVISSDRAELALLVRDDYQGIGLGGGLAATLAELAAQRGVRFLTATILAENRPMVSLVVTRGARRVGGYGPELLYELPVPPGRDDTSRYQPSPPHQCTNGARRSGRIGSPDASHRLRRGRIRLAGVSPSGSLSSRRWGVPTRS
jgi:GNAT superfamily N-acetyltransferase